MSWCAKKLDMVDIEEYNILIYGQRCVKVPMTKVRRIRDGKWSKSEMDKMKKNRKEAQALYDKIKAL